MKFLQEGARSKNAKTLQEFMDKAEEHINADDTIKAFTDQARRTAGGTDKKRKEHPHESRHVEQSQPRSNGELFKPFESNCISPR